MNRWVSADPLEIHAGESSDANAYAYVSGRALKSVDPLGLTVPCGEECKTRNRPAIVDWIENVRDALSARGVAKVPKLFAAVNWGLPTALASDPVVGVGSVASAPRVAFQVSGRANRGVLAIAKRLSPKELGKIAGSVLQRVSKGQVWVVGTHGEMDEYGKRAGLAQSHHGIMSRWMRALYGDLYNADKAPAVLMAEKSHEKTFAVQNKFRDEMKQKMGGTLDWAKVKPEEMRELADRMFDAAGTPKSAREEYFKRFDAFVQSLEKAKAGAK